MTNKAEEQIAQWIQHHRAQTAFVRWPSGPRAPDTDEAEWTRRRVYESGRTLNASGLVVSATCTQCGWHRTYQKWGNRG